MSTTTAEPTEQLQEDGLDTDTDLVHTCCRVEGLANPSAKSCQNGQFVRVERRVLKGKLKGRYKVRVIGTQRVFAVKHENLVLCDPPPAVQLESDPASSRFVPDVSSIEPSCAALHRTTSSSTARAEEEHYVTIDDAKVTAFAEFVRAQVAEGGEGCEILRRGGTIACRRLPLQFDDAASEINYWVVRNLLNFGSGFLKDGDPREMADLVDRGCLSTFLTKSHRFDTEFMSRFNLHDVQQYFGIKVGWLVGWSVAHAHSLPCLLAAWLEQTSPPHTLWHMRSLIGLARPTRSFALAHRWFTR